MATWLRHEVEIKWQCFQIIDLQITQQNKLIYYLNINGGAMQHDVIDFRYIAIHYNVILYKAQ